MKDKIIEILKEELYISDFNGEQVIVGYDEAFDCIDTLYSGCYNEKTINPEAEFYDWWETVAIREPDKGAALVGFVESYHWFKNR